MASVRTRMGRGILLAAPFVAVIACTYTGPEPFPADTDGGYERLGEHDAHTSTPPPHPVDAAGSGGMFCPTDSVTFVPKWTPPMPIHQGKCTQAQINGYLSGCLGRNATQQTCAPFQTGAALDCAKCIETNDTDPAYGPIVHHYGQVVANIAGCVASAEGAVAQGTGCARAFEALDQCHTVACGAGSCPSIEDPEACYPLADQGACKPYIAPTDCVNALTDAQSAAAACVPRGTFEQQYRAIVPLFCGDAPEDSGAADAGDGGG